MSTRKSVDAILWRGFIVNVPLQRKEPSPSLAGDQIYKDLHAGMT
jgi:hypothetical protein